MDIPEKYLNNNETKNILLNIIAQNHLAFLRLDDQLHITYWNDNAAAIFGYTSAEATGRRLSSLISTKENRRSHQDYLTGILKLPSNHSDTGLYIDKSGETIYCEWYYSPIYDNDRNISGLFAIADNITPNVILQKKLEKIQKNNLLTIFAKAPIGIYQADIEGNLINVNPELAWMLGYESAASLIHELNDISTQLFIVPEKSNEFFFTLFEAEQVSQFKAEVKRKDGSTLWGLFNAQLTRDKDGRKNGFFGFLIDITRTVKAENALIEAKQVAEKATRTKSEFLANMSHEIRTPLNAIIGFTDLVLRTDLSSKQNDYVRKAGVAGRTLLGIINDILDFSKIEAGHLELEIREFHIHELINNIIDIFSGKVAEKGINLFVYITPDVPEILIGDDLRLSQILINLINNAIKFTASGEVVLSVYPLKISDETTTIHFSVSDTGIGMTESQQKKLFSSFSQVDASTSRKYGGTGLGLTISKKLIELMGGDIQVKSEKDSGSVFSCKADFGYIPNKMNLPEILRGKKVLLLSNNPAMHEIIMMMFIPLQIKTDPVTNIDKLHKTDNSHDLLIISQDTEAKSFHQILRSVKNHDFLKEKPTILITEQGVDVKGVNMTNIHGNLEKPLKQTELINTIAAFFGLPSVYKLPGIEKTKEDSHDLNGVRVLLVEDNEINQEVASEILKDKGIDVEIADNGRIAIEKIKQKRTENKSATIYDIVLMDIQMPEMDGYETTREIRKLETEWAQDSRNKPPKLPIIAMSAHALSTEIELCNASGMDAYVSKPIEPTALFDELARWAPSGTPEPTAQGAPVIETPSTHSPGRRVINIDGGIEKVAGNSELYFSLLKKFSLNYRETAQAISDAIADIRLEDAANLIHSIKGTAGNLGGEQLFDCSVTLERMIRDKKIDQATQQMDIFRENLTTFLREIEAEADQVGIKSDTKPSSSLEKPIEEGDLIKQIHALKSTVDEDIDEAKERFNSLRQFIEENIQLGTILNTIEKGFEEFETESVIQALDQLNEALMDTEKPDHKEVRQQILVVDDVSQNIAILVSLLKSDYKMIAAKSGEGALKRCFSKNPPDLILLDVNMPGMDGYEVCRNLKSDDRTQHIPVIFITAASEIQDQEKGFEIGAVDYISKPIIPSIVKMRVRTQLKLKQQQDILANLATIDGLTQIPNRRSFDERLESERKRCLRNGKALSVILMDIDHFKKYNDHYGHQAGDDCLKKVAETLASACQRSSDFIARYGGEEFVAILPETDRDGALILAARIKEAVEKQALPHDTSDTSDHVTLSLGIYSAIPDETVSSGYFVEMADKQLYKAKENGRNRFE